MKRKINSKLFKLKPGKGYRLNEARGEPRRDTERRILQSNYIMGSSDMYEVVQLHCASRTVV
jgi:hypothetical protein